MATSPGTQHELPDERANSIADNHNGQAQQKRPPLMSAGFGQVHELRYIIMQICLR